MVCHKPLADK